MAEKPEDSRPNRPSRSTLRLTFRVTEGGFELSNVEQLAMITPPQPGEPPKVGKHGGLWAELQDGRKKTLAYRPIRAADLHSVEVHSPDGKIERVFGGVRDEIFEVLLPDTDDARSVVLMGSAMGGMRGDAESAQSSGEIARFVLPKAK